MNKRVSVRANTGAMVRLYVFDCPSCGVIFGIPDDYDDRRRDDGRTFYCPNGHHVSYLETEADRLRKEAERLRTKVLAQMDQTRAAEREAAEAKAAEVRLRWRVGNGVCPCCQRTFPGLAAHVANKHPEFLTRDLSDLSARQVGLLANLRARTDKEDAAVVGTSGIDWRSLRALERRGLVQIVTPGRVALTEHGWPLAEQAVAR